MENYPPYTYPDSATSSPRSRELDFDPNPNPNPAPSSWEDQPNPNHKVKFMVSYNGKIQPRSHDNLLSYIGGDTKILSVDRSVKFSVIYSKLSSLVSQLDGFDGVDFSFKYQLPGEDLDALISVTNDDDLEHMMHEYDRLWKGNNKPSRLRLFLFFDHKSKNNSTAGGGGGGGGSAFSSVSSEPGKLGLDRIVSDPTPVSNNNVDFLFGLDKVLPVQAPGPNPVQINEMNRIHHLQMQQQQQQHHLQQSAIYAANNEESFVDRERKSPQMANFPGNMQQPQPPQMPPGYWQQIEQQQFLHHQIQQQQQQQPQQMHQEYQQPPQQQQQPVYMMHTPPPPQGNIFHGGAGMMQQPNQPFYQQGGYMEQPPQQPVYTTPAAIPAMIPAGNTAAHIRPGEVVAGYGQVAYDSSTGRQVYYTAAPPQGGVVAPPYSGVATTVASGGGGGDIRGSGDGKVVQKIVTNPSVV